MASQSRCSSWRPAWRLQWTRRTAPLCARPPRGTPPRCLSRPSGPSLPAPGGGRAASARAPGCPFTLGLSAPARLRVSLPRAQHLDVSPPMGMHTFLRASAHAAVDVRLLFWTKMRPGMQARAILQSCMMYCCTAATTSLKSACACRAGCLHRVWLQGAGNKCSRSQPLEWRGLPQDSLRASHCSHRPPR